MACQTFSLLLGSADETARYAQTLGATLRPADVVLLEGPVGAGKTHFARQLIQSILTDPEDVPSPTFTLVQSYETTRGTLWHADLYRLSSVFEVEELGLSEAFETAICLVEWPDRLGALAPPDALTLSFSPADKEEARHLTATWTAQRWSDPIQSWAAA
ncbi:tRNA (adenosine(37)-N6)-threonylcarbamoyltransferase complex ATPase subunit type 1 TsaE [Roseobacter weihaiensis]|uniref:tRNA (adenosine(37)-N6)-threonylcarbamoyltransferase complex ATPase subunit type 1 TsaE n=1 Tax=Roseobacter weihaiensis TaxID=2763262 RepID=UPI001D09C7CA|nr:tRNA (adenosine(37)-N6)-threonylcarbamoyltransferase complex ATPase subunit type 1 TsaE [Roseobacter sp. H9]